MIKSISRGTEWLSGLTEHNQRRLDSLAAGVIFLWASHGVRRTSAIILSLKAWQKPTGAPLEILLKHNTHVYQPTQYKNLQFPPPTKWPVAPGYQKKRK